MTTILSSIQASSRLFDYSFPHTTTISTAALIDTQDFLSTCIRDAVPSERMLFKPSFPSRYTNVGDMAPLDDEDEEEGMWPADLRVQTPRKKGITGVADEKAGVVSSSRRSTRGKSGIHGLAYKTGDGMEDCERNLAEALRLLDICPIPHLKDRVRALSQNLTSIKASIARSEKLLQASVPMTSKIESQIQEEEDSVAALEEELKRLRQAKAAMPVKKATIKKPLAKITKESASIQPRTKLTKSRVQEAKPLAPEDEQDYDAFLPKPKLILTSVAPSTSELSSQIERDPEIESEPPISNNKEPRGLERSELQFVRDEMSASTAHKIQAPSLTSSQVSPKVNTRWVEGLTDASISRALSRIQTLYPSLPSDYDSLLSSLPSSLDGEVLRQLLLHHATASAKLPVHVRPPLSASLFGDGGQEANEALVSMDALKSLFEGQDITKAVYQLVGRRVLRIDRRRGREALVGFA